MGARFCCSARCTSPEIERECSISGGGCGSVGVAVGGQRKYTTTSLRNEHEGSISGLWGCWSPGEATNHRKQACALNFGVVGLLVARGSHQPPKTSMRARFQSLVAAAREIQPAGALVFGSCERLWGWLVGAANEAYHHRNECKTLDFGGDVWRRRP